jgi:hypothetical protein
MDGGSDGRTAKCDTPTFADKLSIPKPCKVFCKSVTPRSSETVKSLQTNGNTEEFGLLGFSAE